jgi:Glucosidase II beta subunit-like protein
VSNPAIKTEAERIETEKKAEADEWRKGTCAGKYGDLLSHYKRVNEEKEMLKTTVKNLLEQLDLIVSDDEVQSDETKLKPITVTQEVLEELVALRSEYAHVKTDIDTPLPTHLNELPEENPCTVNGTIYSCASYSTKIISSKILAKLPPLNIFTAPSDAALAENPDMAREEYNKASTKKDEMQREVSKIKELAQIDFGKDSEWDSLHHKCFDLNVPEYTYNICLFGKVTQKPKSGYGDVPLGTFTRWGNKKSEGGYNYMYIELIQDV